MVEYVPFRKERHFLGEKKIALFVIVHCSDRGILRDDTWLEGLVKLSDTQKVLGSVQVFLCGVQIFSQ